MKLLWMCDSWIKVNNQTETTIRLIHESIRIHHDNWFCDTSTLNIKRGKLKIEAHFIYSKMTNLFLKKPASLTLLQFDKIFFRCDPPFNEQYINKLKLIRACMLRGDIKIDFINDIDQLLTLNSKLSCLIFKNTPQTVFSSNFQILNLFGSQNKKVVAKHVGFGSSAGVFLLRWDKTHEIKKSKRILKEMTCSFKEPILLQKFMSSFYEKEIRVWFACGEMIASVGKRTFNNNFPFDLDSGSYLEKCILSKTQIQLIKQIKKFLISYNIKMAAIDIIEDQVIDINIGSPGLLVEMEKELKWNIAGSIVKSILSYPDPQRRKLL